MVLIGIDELLTNFGIGQMIAVREALTDVRAQTPQMLQEKMLEVMAMIVMMRKNPRRILRQ